MNRKILTEVILRALSEYDWTSGKGADSKAMAESIAVKILSSTYDLYTPDQITQRQLTLRDAFKNLKYSGVLPFRGK